MQFQLCNLPTNVFSAEQITLTLSSFVFAIIKMKVTISSQIHDPENKCMYNRKAFTVKLDPLFWFSPS